MRYVLGEKRAAVVEEVGSDGRPNEDDALATSAQPVERRSPDRQSARLTHPRLKDACLPQRPCRPEPETRPVPGRLPSGDVDPATVLIVYGDEKGPVAAGVAV